MKEYINKLIYKLTHNKKICIALASLVLVGVIGVTAAVVYFKSEIENKFSTSAYNIAIEEEFYDDWGTKKVSIVNHDATPVVIRVAYIETWSNKNEESDATLQLSNKINGVDTVTKEWTDDWNNEFTLNSDGWYYYNKVLTSNEAVQILNSIELNKEVIKTSKENYNLYDYELDFRYEAIQATSDAIKEIWGHNVTISDNNVSWGF